MFLVRYHDMKLYLRIVLQIFIGPVQFHNAQTINNGFELSLLQRYGCHPIECKSHNNDMGGRGVD